jgi:hypothetical protein
VSEGQRRLDPSGVDRLDVVLMLIVAALALSLTAAALWIGLR